ncbi:MAG: Rhamnose utilization protein RhaD, predicted bifunctional aldolase and dehydrogenase [Candidatus Electronema aureum]|uniref:Rhamnose utilization protein RhaD, predicted bifunctional aldolase and dehydrogenase n=1 Tax=Candidatus Electronema aureum TaxID=2005002 RepID=A0A521G405_9BACT|nr:MAG: Rhamnose utilization protein RhaD, predicted bifunctional aldolase and dehydrogenase [Candidatus Electronema aureum]
MHSLWNATEAAACTDDLALRVYSSRLLGRDPSLVLHGGGNTSLKIIEKNLFGEDEEILYVKGSGWNLASIEAAGFAPVRLRPMLRLAQLDTLTDPQMVNELKINLVRADAPTPSVETILHAALPFRYVDHTHADAVVTICNTPDGLRRITELYGELAVIVPYVMPGFDLARVACRSFVTQAKSQTIGMVLMNHGIFSFGDTARESYERMIRLVDMAETYLREQGAWELNEPAAQKSCCNRREIGELRHVISVKAGRPMILNVTGSQRGFKFARRTDGAEIAGRGPVTPDHVLRTKALPLIGRDVEGYAEIYRCYFQAHEPLAKERKTMLDPAPRVILDSELGLCCVGGSTAEASIVADIYEHTMDCILRAERLGGWQPLPLGDLFAVEYWDLEQAKLKKSGKLPVFSGEIVLITGAASGIGKACVESFLRRGASVVGLDISSKISSVSSSSAFLGLQCDITDEVQIAAALDQAVLRFGGIDILVLNAGMFPASKTVAELSCEEWRRVMAVNLDANLILLRETHPLLKTAPGKGRVVVIGSKNVPAPGPGAAAYSASKAALTQLMRVTALEWGKDGIRINALHPNAIFDTGIWTDEILQARAKHYGLTVQKYKTNNLLGVEVQSRDVAELAAEMCGPFFACTTAAQLPIDGGNERVV